MLVPWNPSRYPLHLFTTTKLNYTWHFKNQFLWKQKKRSSSKDMIIQYEWWRQWATEQRLGIKSCSHYYRHLTAFRAEDNNGNKKVGVPVSGFWLWISTWNMLPWSLFPACSHRTNKTLIWLCARSWKIRLKVIQTFFLRSSQVTKVGTMGMTLRPNKLRSNGRRPLHRDRKKQDKWGQTWKQCSLFFFMFEE